MINDGGMALYAIRSEAFQHIVLDIKLPTMNGLQLAAIVKSSDKNKNTPITIASGHVNDDNLRRIKSLKIARVVEKPFVFSELADMVAEVVKKKGPSYDAKIINTFMTSASEIFAFYGLKDTEIGKPNIRQTHAPAKGIITGILAFTGNGYAGSIALSVNVRFIKTMAAHIFAGAEVELNQAVAADIVGEICNQILGIVKSKFGQMGLKMTLGLPEMVLGKEHTVIHKVNNPVLVMPIDLGGGAECHMEFCMDKRELQGDEDAAEKDQVEAGSALLFD